MIFLIAMLLAVTSFGKYEINLRPSFDRYESKRNKDHLLMLNKTSNTTATNTTNSTAKSNSTIINKAVDCGPSPVISRDQTLICEQPSPG